MDFTDKLEHDERLRLEALAQSIMASSMIGDTNQTDNVIERARLFEDFIRNGLYPEKNSARHVKRHN